MSLASVPLGTYGNVDPLIRQFEKITPVTIGGRTVNYQVLAATNINDQSDGGSIYVDINPASENVYIDRAMYLRLCARLKLQLATSTTGVQNGVYLIREDCFSLRSFPAQKAMDNILLMINNNPFSVEIGKLISMFELFNVSERCRKYDLSRCATYPINQSTKFSSLYGTNRNPLGKFDAGVAGALNVGAQYTVVTNPLSASQGVIAYVDLVSTEPLFLAPCYFSEISEDSGAFLGVNQMSVTFNFSSGGANRMVCIDPSSPSGSPLFDTEANARSATVATKMFFQNHDVDNVGAWSYPKSSSTAMLIKQITPSELDENIKVQSKFYPLTKSRVWTTGIGSVAAGAGSNIFSASMQQQTVPSRCVWGVRVKDTVLRRNPFHPDTFLQVWKTIINWGNDSYLQGASIEHLYAISAGNGLEVPYGSWSGLGIVGTAAAADFGKSTSQYKGCGSVCAATPMDLGLPLRQAPGKSEYFNLQLDVYYVNTSDLALDCDLVVVLVQQGAVFIGDGNCIENLGVISENDILNANKNANIGMMSYNEIKELYGGAEMNCEVKEELKKLVQKAAPKAAGAKVNRQMLRERLGM